jgi:hypothetical protein
MFADLGTGPDAAWRCARNHSYFAAPPPRLRHGRRLRPISSLTERQVLMDNDDYSRHALQKYCGTASLGSNTTGAGNVMVTN